MILGTGSIVDSTLADLYMSLGSNFIVGPVTNSEVAKACNRKQIPYIPGCLTPTEISLAQELGCDVVKIFPADSIGGPSFVKSVMAPMPWVKIMPTGGVDTNPDSLKKWFDSGVFAVGMGSKLFTKEIISGNSHVDTKRAAEYFSSCIVNEEGREGFNSFFEKRNLSFALKKIPFKACYCSK